MPRVAPDDVRAAMQETHLSDADLSVFIRIAAMRVTEEVEPHASYSEQRYTELERLLSAHYAASADPSSDRETVNAVSIEYETVPDDLQQSTLDETRYGRRAQELDTGGWLSTEATGAEFVSFGTKAEWDDYYHEPSWGGPS